jgi:hypothetical protein
VNSDTPPLKLAISDQDASVQIRRSSESDVASIAARGARVRFNQYRSDYIHLDKVIAAEVLAIDHKAAYVLAASSLALAH